MYDTIIIGSGPAGCAAVVYLSKTMRSIAWITGELKGGQPNNTDYVDNYVGFGKIEGVRLAAGLYAHAHNDLSDTNTDNSVYEFNAKTLIKEDSVYKVTTDKDHVIIGKSVIVASGMSPKGLDLDCEQELIGRGISTCAVCDAIFARDKDVAVIGGNYGALESALYLSKTAKSVDLIYRGDKFRSDRYLQQKVSENPKINPIMNTIVTKYLYEISILPTHDKLLTGVSLKTGKNKEFDKEYMSVFLNVGYTPNLNFLSEDLDKEDSFVMCGDLTNKVKQIMNACTSGMEASMKIGKYLDKEG